ncbi:hypothetical protein HYW29_00285 [Candidatus Amesbacteria bacterium]|nr:hypothetical protein [Candidatus Amesbacteria bacterium]
MKLVLILIIFVMGVFVSFGFSRRPASPPANTRAAATSNPFGVMFANTGKVKLAGDLGVVFYRPVSVFVDRWDGSCAECDEAVSAGLKLVLTVRNNGGPQQPSTPPTDIPAYKKAIGEIIDKYRPVVLAVENEENSEALFYSGTPEQYHSQLKAACEVAHSKGVKCTNGGLVSSLVALLVTEDYAEKGGLYKANSFLKGALGPKLEVRFGAAGAVTILGNPKAARQIARGKALIAGYKEAGADFVNFHWYIADTEALETAVSYMQQASGLPAVTNEVGQQKNEDPAQVTAVMQKIVDLKLPVAIWFSVDVPGYGGARSLVEKNGELRPNGEAFRDLIEKTF